MVSIQKRMTDDDRCSHRRPVTGRHTSVARSLAFLALWCAVGGCGGPVAESSADGESDGQDTVAAARVLFQQQDFDGAAALLDRITEAEPDNGQAWNLLGRTRQAKEDLDGAMAAYLEAIEVDATAGQAAYNIAAVHCLRGEADAAFDRLHRLKEGGGFDLTAIALDPNMDAIENDPRFSSLLPTSEEFADPFVEDVRIIHEWRGESVNEWFGWIARNIGDVDGDAINDLTTSAPNKEIGGAGAGAIYVYSGGTGDLLWTHNGEPGNQLGMGIEAGGDTNGDGEPDVVAGAPGADKVYVFSGRDGTVLLEIGPEHKGEQFGQHTTDVGDYNGDGYDDIAAGAPSNDFRGEDAGRAGIYSGKDGSLLVSLYGEEAGDQFGSTAAGMHDGEFAFLVIGAPNAGEGDRGRTYVYRDGATEPTFVIESDDTGAQLGGMFVSVVGDVDADGIPDVYASDWANNAKGRSTGRIYVHSGAGGERLHTLTGEAAGDGFGIGPADAGDVDGDGHDDLIIGAWQQGNAAAGGGKVYLFSGEDARLLREITGKVQGETFGFDATGMGDVDGDGAVDFLLTSAWSAVEGARSGRMYIVAGEPVRGD